MICEQGPENQAEIVAILTRQIDQAMFPLSSLRAVALHLAEARASGVARAVLFAASDAAACAYRAIGFQPAEPFTLFLLATPARIEA